MDTPTEQLMNAKELAAYLNVHPNWVWNQAKTDLIPCVRFGRNLRFRRDQIDRWLEEQSRAAIRSTAGSRSRAAPRRACPEAHDALANSP